MTKKFSIAEAKDRLSKLVHNVERGGMIEITRRGKPVAVLLSASDYARLRQERPGFWEACARFREQTDPAVLPEGHDFVAGLRDRAPGRPLAL